jgi:hypothetical protein
MSASASRLLICAETSRSAIMQFIQDMHNRAPSALPAARSHNQDVKELPRETPARNIAPMLRAAPRY